MHSTLSIQDVGLSYKNKTCFSHFSTDVYFGSRIAVIGKNGAGKSSLLNILKGTCTTYEGCIVMPGDVVSGYVPQVIDSFHAFSGGQRFNHSLTEALSLSPNLLLLDEPTNHLDRKNRKSLMRMLNSFYGTLIIVSHDTELLHHCFDTYWHIDQGNIQVFTGRYDDYLREQCYQKQSLEKQVTQLNRQKKDLHRALMKEQHRATNSREKGAKSIDQRKWPTIVSKAKMGRSQQTSGRKKKAIDDQKQGVLQQLSGIYVPETITPTFSLPARSMGHCMIVSVRGGTVRYGQGDPVVSQVSLSLAAKGRMAIVGNNGSGKSTLIKAIMKSESVTYEGDWSTPKAEDIGYLDQHYANIGHRVSVMESLSSVVDNWSHTALRKHLNDFLFRKNDEVNAPVEQLSGGEKARLSLALIAAKMPRLLILDEITNNLDIETKNHVIDILRVYPGAMIVISHDDDFLETIGIEHSVTL